MTEQEPIAFIVDDDLSVRRSSGRTIKFRRSHIVRKMRAESLADLVRMVEKLGASS
jgi:hypothetical protein